MKDIADQNEATRTEESSAKSASVPRSAEPSHRLYQKGQAVSDGSAGEQAMRSIPTQQVKVLQGTYPGHPKTVSKTGSERPSYSVIIRWLGYRWPRLDYIRLDKVSNGRRQTCTMTMATTILYY